VGSSFVPSPSASAGHDPTSQSRVDIRQHCEAAEAAEGAPPLLRAIGKSSTPRRDAMQLGVSREAGSVQKTPRRGACCAPGAHNGPVAPTVTPARRANVSGSGRRWSMFAAHPWSIINDHRGRPGSLLRLASTVIHGSVCGALVPGPRGIALAPWVCMDERSVRGRQEGEAAYNAAESPPFSVDDRLAATIPGVPLRVQSLLRRRTPGCIRRARGRFAYLARTERDASTLSDASYPSAGFALGGRLPSHNIVLSLRLRRAPSDVR
jgi:hypothetical protein